MLVSFKISKTMEQNHRHVIKTNTEKFKSFVTFGFSVLFGDGAGGWRDRSVFAFGDFVNIINGK